MKMKVAVCLLFAMFLCGCSPSESAAEPAADGFFSAGMFASGGTAEGAVDLNAKSLSLFAKSVDAKDEVVLSFSFVSGSRISGSVQEAPGCGVPLYSIYTLDQPARLVVELDNLSHWDYRRVLSLDHPLIKGSFQHTLFNSPRVSIFFQLAQPVRFFVEVDGDELRIRLRPQALGEANRYYVTANAYDAYRSGAISAETDLTPTLASDNSNVLMISPPFATKEEASGYLLSAKSLYPSIADDLWRAVELAPGKLPDYDNTLAFLTAYKTPAVRLPDGQVRTLPVLVPDGLYLCALPDGRGFLYSKAVVTEDGDGYEQLYRMQQGEKSSLVMSFEFAAIEQAKYSPDGRKLAVLERTSSSTHLYVFDADTYELLNDLSEMGFGSNTSTFIWNSLGNILYAITGPSDSQLHQFDYSIPDEKERHSVVDRNSVDEGSLGYCDGEMYFAHATMEGGSTIYRIKPDGGVRKPFLPGSRFAISDDARYMAIASTSESSGSTSSKSTFLLYEFATGSKLDISSAFFPYDFIWSPDCTKLYYIESRVSGGQNESDTSDDAGPDAASASPTGTPAGQDATAQTDPYPYTLWVYDVLAGQSTRLIDLSAPDVFPAANNQLYLNRLETGDASTNIRATYLLDLDAVFTAPAEPAANGALTIGQ